MFIYPRQTSKSITSKDRTASKSGRRITDSACQEYKQHKQNYEDDGDIEPDLTLGYYYRGGLEIEDLSQFILGEHATEGIVT